MMRKIRRPWQGRRGFTIYGYLLFVLGQTCLGPCLERNVLKEKARLLPNHKSTDSLKTIHQALKLSAVFIEIDLRDPSSANCPSAQAHLIRWLISHPEFASRPVYIGSHSYTGIPVPPLVQAIIDGNRAGRKPLVNIKGYLLGNPLTDMTIDGNAGDHDMIIPFPGTQAWIRSLNYSIFYDWRPWAAKGQVARYTRTYANGMTFATVKAWRLCLPSY